MIIAAQDMADPARKIEEGRVAFIKGTDPKDAFQPFGAKRKAVGILDAQWGWQNEKLRLELRRLEPFKQ